MNTPSFFTKLLPKCPEVTGTSDQAFSFAEDFGTMVLKLIQTKTLQPWVQSLQGALLCSTSLTQ